MQAIGDGRSNEYQEVKERLKNTEEEEAEEEKHAEKEVKDEEDMGEDEDDDEKVKIITVEGDTALLSLIECCDKPQRLKELTITRCSCRCFPETFGNFSGLQTLVIKDCELEYLPESFGSICNLQRLLIESSKIEYLPESFGSLCNLEYLELSAGNSLRLPESFGRLHRLEVLIISSDFVELNGSFEQLQALKRLVISTLNLQCLPESFGSLQNLQNLEILGCKSRNLPYSFGSLCNLQRLVIRHCKFEYLPESFGNLCNLEELTIEDNKLFVQLNESFGQLQALKKLDISFCKLQCLPESFGSLQNLEHLELTATCLQCLPDSFGNLQRLVYLNLSTNKLQEYPMCTLQLSNLRELDICNHFSYDLESSGDEEDNDDVVTHSGNCIAELPVELAETSLEVLDLDGNPITFPPAAIWEQGLDEIKTYMKEIRRGREQIRSDTINMLGESEAGKTSIALSLAEGKPNAAEPDDRTRVMQQLWLKVDAEFSVSINDFGGHPIYHSVIPIFLPSNGLKILALNLNSDIDLQIQVKSWLLTAFLKSTEIRVLICGTRSDLISEGECLSLTQKLNNLAGSVRNILISEVEEQIRELQFLKENSHAEDRQRELDALKKKFQVAKCKVATVSCVEDNGSLKELHKNVVDLIERRLDTMPAHWCIVMNGILDHQGQDFPCLTMDHLKQNIYKKCIEDDPECKNLPIILRYLVASSQIIWLEHDKNLCNFIFNSPQRIVEICKKVLDHDQASGFVEKWADDRQGSASAQHFKNFLDEYKRGILTEQLLEKLLSSNQESNVNLIINFLQHFNLLCEIRNHESLPTKARKFVIPSNLPEKDPDELLSFVQRLCDCSVTVCVALSFLGDMVPRSFFETSLSSMLTVANKLSEEPSDTGQWRHGLYICHDGVYCIVRRLDTRVTATAGSSYEQNPWSVLLPVLKALLQNVSSSWPGEPSQCAVLCPACQYYKETDVGEIKVFPKELLDHRTAAESGGNTNRPCPKCKRFVPRSLCYPVSKDSFSNEKEAIQNFYKSIADDKELNFNANKQVCRALPQVPAGSAATGRCDFTDRKRWRENAESTAPALKQKKTAATGICNKGTHVNMSTELQRNLRSLGPDLLEQLALENVRTIALYMESRAGLNRTELDHITRCTTGQDSVMRLLDVTRARGDASIVLLAQALRRIEKDALAERLSPVA